MDLFDSGAGLEPAWGAGVGHEALEKLWQELESVRDAYFRATPVPAARFAELRAALGALDPRDFQPQHPHARGIIECALRELDQWEDTWPPLPGVRVAPSSFGALVLLHGYA